MYKPNFCSECGSKVGRTRWRPWTSRRFCASCAPRFRKSQFFQRAAAALALFCVGLVAGRAVRPAAPPLTIERGGLQAAALPQANAEERTAAKETTAEGMTAEAATPKEEPAYGPDGTATERPTDPDEVVSICGARTQKGAPCRRRVRGVGRCWQHKGLPAIIPAEKLIVTGK